MDGIVQTISALSGDPAQLQKQLDALQLQLASNVSQVPAALQALDPTLHSLGCCYLLLAQARSPMDIPTAQQFIESTSGVLKACAAAQVQQAPAAFVELCRRYKDKLIDGGVPRLGVQPLQVALRRLQPTPETLTPLHADALQLCILAKTYAAAVPILDDDILVVDPARTGLVPSDLLLYCLYGGMAATARRQYGRALELYVQALTAPSGVASAITCEVYKKYVLVSLLHAGTVAPLPKFASHRVRQMVETECRPYNDLASAFANGRPEAARRVATDKQAAFAADGNTGLLRLAMGSQTRRAIQRLTATYVTLSLQDIAAAVGLANAAAAEAALLDMIAAGHIHARIHAGDGMVRFLEAPEAYSGAAMAANIDGHIKRCMELAARVAAVNEAVSTDRAYVSKVVVKDRVGTLSRFDTSDEFGGPMLFQPSI